MLRSQIRTVAVAMSGGVDSAVAALLLQKAGYRVHGIFMRTWNAEDANSPLSDCPWKTDLDDAKNVCEQLGISFEVVNMISKYRDLVVKDLVDGYCMGITPNPDVLCNARIKFGALKKYAQENGFNFLATGHYCRIKSNSDGRINIFEGIDKNKDQSYFLAMLSREQIKNVIFPIGNLTKPQVRQLAEQAHLCNAKKKDSQGICFLGKVKIQDFLSHYIDDKPGEIVDCNNKILGQHNGLFRFTIGQRHGINLPSNADFLHYVVIGKDLDKNQLIVEIERPNSENLYKREFFVKNIIFQDANFTKKNILARPRYRDPAQKIEISLVDEFSAQVTFKKPQRAIARGQIIAFYQGEKLLGGGVFS